MTIDDDEKCGSDRPACRPRRTFLRKAARIIVLAGALLALAVLLMVVTPITDWIGDRLVVIDPMPAEKADYIVVLSGNIERTAEAARLYREGLADRVIISSNGPDVDHQSRIAQLCGVPQQAIVLDRQAANTAGHPRSLVSSCGIDPETSHLILITSIYHTSRAKACFDKAGYKHFTMRVPVWRDYEYKTIPHSMGSRWRDLEAILREVAAWGWYRLHGWV